jgi:nitrous oxidase accessory protein NosD
MTGEASGAHFEIWVDGEVRSQPVSRENAIEGVRFLRARDPGAKITIWDLRDGSVVPWQA